MNTRWHIAICQPGQDNLAARQLVRRKYSVFRPTIPIKRVNRWGGTVNGSESMFPGYLFVQPNQYGWEMLRTCPGMICGERSLLMRNYRLVSIADNDPDFKAIGRTVDEKWAAFRGNPSPFEPGDLVRIKIDPWMNFLATVETVDKYHRLVALLDLFGRKVRADVDSRYVTKV